MAEDRVEQLRRLIGIVDRLRAPDGCPWDREQTLESMVPCAMEEAAEVADAVASGCAAASCEEIGDLLMNVILMSRIAEQDGAFSLADVARGISDKLVRRHPHVFAELRVQDTEEVLSNWEAIKESEKPGDRPSRMDGIPAQLSALQRAQKVIRRASRAGFRWSSADAAWEKVDEELAELREASEGAQAQREEELGDVLFSLVALCEHLEVDPDRALRRANQKFERRFRGVEKELPELATASFEQMLKAWRHAKRDEGGEASPV